MNQPSDYFLAAVLRAYDAEAVTGKPVSPSAIWDHICMAAIQERGAFTRLFEWDTRKAKSINRIGTIRDCIAAGQVPGLRLTTDERGHQIVVRERQP